MLKFFKGKDKGNLIYAPCKGRVVPLAEVPDPVFADKVLGDGFAVIPADGRIYAPAAQKTWLILPLGIAAFIVFYVVFLFAIKKFDLKTPGREDDDDLEAEKNIELANDDYTAIAAKILEGCGGKENITSIDNCITRLRLEVKDITAVNDKVIKSAGVAGVIKPGKTSVQVIIGTKVQFVADAFSALCK